MTRRESFAWGLVSLVFLGGVAWTATHLTFFWDDYNAILTMKESAFGALFKGSGGHWTPLTGVFFFIEVHVFGYWYPGYVLTSGALVCLSWWLLAWALATWTVQRRWLWIVAGILYLTCVGVLVNIFVATTVSFLLATAFGTAAALALVRGKTIAGCLLLLGSFLSMSGIFMVMATLVAAVLFVHSVIGTATGVDRPRISWRLPVVLLLLGVAGTAIGHQLAVMNPTDYYDTASQVVSSDAEPSGSAVTAIRTAMFLFAAWVPAPLLPGALSSTTMLTTLSILLDKYSVVIVAGAAVGVAVWVVLVRRDSRKGGGRFPAPLSIGVLLLPAAVWAAEVAWARPDAVFTLRYALVWLLAVLSFWLIALTRAPRTSVLTWLGRLGTVLLAASALVGVVLFPRSLVASTNVDRPRWELSAVQDEQQRACLRGESIASVEEIAPTFTDDQVCEVARYVTESSLTGVLLGYPEKVRPSAEEQ